jgi:hypothetical protein
MFVGFPEIQLLHNVVRLSEAYPHLVPGPITYRGKIKLHGTNAGVTIADGQVIPQSRTQALTVNDDNKGFAKWVEANKNFWLSLPNMTVFGEWCGPGIAKKTAINLIPNKIFAVFAIIANNKFISDPETITTLLKNHPQDMHVLPWYGDAFTVHYFDRPGLQVIADRLNEVVQEVEPSDPWVKATFGVDGIGEGVVYYPNVEGQQGSIELFENFAFKAKGVKHSVVKTKEAVQIAPEVAASIDEFVSMFVTEPRLEQGLAAIGGSLEMKNMLPFLNWVMADIQKESADELKVSNLTWDQVLKHVQAATRSWFGAKSRDLRVVT